MTERELIIAGLLASAEKDIQDKQHVRWTSDILGNTRHKLRLRARAKIYLAEFLLQECDKKWDFLTN